MKEKIGFIGLGIMGKPMARNLIKAGYSLVVYDINPEPVKELCAEGAEEGKSPKDLAGKCRVILTMLPDAKDVRDVIFGGNGIVEGAGKNAVLIDMSSISPTASKEIAGELAKHNIAMLDAPVSGGEVKAIDGTLAFMVGGPEEVFEKHKDILLAMGSTAVLIGESGNGSMTKLANQIIVNLNIAAMSEALVLAAKAGVDPEKVYEAIRGGLAGSVVLDAKAPLVLKRDFRPGGRISINLKDINNVMETAHEMNVPLPLTAMLREIMYALKVDGKLNDDHGGIIQYFEKLAGITVEKRNNSN